MKKTILAAMCAALAISASAQNVTDALRFSQTEYYGTARSIAMGNAFTALGGDLGSVNINPAGSAVNSYSQVTITPSLNIMAGTADYSSYGRVGDGNPYTTTTNRKANLTMPNVGVMMYYNTHNKHGLRGISFGMVGNATSYYNDDMSAGGTNGRTSYMGYLSAWANGDSETGRARLTTDQLGNASYWDMSPEDWPSMIGYRSGMVNEASDGGYVSPAQNNGPLFNVRGDLDQTYNRVAKGNRYDMVINLGFNFDNKFYLGGNIGIIDIDYRTDSYMREAAVNSEDFPVTINGNSDYFDSMRFHYSYSASGSGIYAKIGFIAIPTEGLRIGGAIQTPTATYLTENLWYSGDTEFRNNSYSAYVSEDDEYIYRYKLNSPFKANVGLAYTIKGLGLISADYEYSDYSTMRFRDVENYYDDTFSSANEGIKDYAGVSHMFRVGAEYTPTSNIAVRAGYNLTTSPERYYDANGAKCTPSACKQAASLGIGYKSAGSFFCDAAIRCLINPTEYVYPYSTYDEYESPEIVVKNNLWNLVLTFGWRF